MRSFLNLMVLGFAVLAAPTTRASDGHDDAPGSGGETTAWTIPLALSADAQDDSGMSVRAFQPNESSARSVFALASDPQDDSGMSARTLDASVQVQTTGRERAAALRETAEPAGDCVCMQ